MTLFQGAYVLVLRPLINVDVFISVDCGFEDGDCIGKQTLHFLFLLKNTIFSRRLMCFPSYLGFNISFPKCRAREPWRIGDGVCDYEYNSEECRFDGGDCS